MILFVIPEYFMVKNMIRKFICGDCKATFNVSTSKRGSWLIEVFLWTTLVIPGFFYTMWRKPRSKKICDYCNSTFILPDTYETQEFLKPIEKK